MPQMRGSKLNNLEVLGFVIGGLLVIFVVAPSSDYPLTVFVLQYSGVVLSITGIMLLIYTNDYVEKPTSPSQISGRIEKHD